MFKIGAIGAAGLLLSQLGLHSFNLRKAYAVDELEDGIYEIIWAGNTDQEICVSEANKHGYLSLIKKAAFGSSSFIFKKESDGYYSITPLFYWKQKIVFDVEKGSCISGQRILTYEDGGTNQSNQRWRPVLNPDGTYSFLCKGNENLCINLSSGNISNPQLILYDYETGGTPGH